MKKIVLKVAAVALFMTGFLAVNANSTDPQPQCNQGGAECSNFPQITCCYVGTQKFLTRAS